MWKEWTARSEANAVWQTRRKKEGRPWLKWIYDVEEDFEIDGSEDEG
jgi:hypothetical protein